MDFPITELLDEELSTDWLLKHFHPDGLQCPRCGSREEEARTFRRTRRSGLVVSRCRQCEPTYNLYSGTVFEHRQLTPMHLLVNRLGIKGTAPISAYMYAKGFTLRTCFQMPRKGTTIDIKASYVFDPLFGLPTGPNDDPHNLVQSFKRLFLNTRAKKSSASRPIVTHENHPNCILIQSACLVTTKKSAVVQYR